MRAIKEYDDATIVEMLGSGGRQETNRAIRYLHKKVYGQVAKFVKKNKGTANDTEDVFQDSLLALYKLARKGALKKEVNVEAYLFSICKNLWLQMLRKKRTIVGFEEKENTLMVDEVPLFRMMKEEEKKEIMRLMGLIGENCRKVLVAFYYKKTRMKEIAEIMGYNTEQGAKNRKYDCLKKLRKLMLQSPVFKNKFEQ